jgi:hypothetical protein
MSNGLMAKEVIPPATCSPVRPPCISATARSAGYARQAPSILLCQIRELPQNFRVRHAADQRFQHVIGGNAQPADAGLATAFPGFGRENVSVRRRVTLFQKVFPGQFRNPTVTGTSPLELFRIFLRIIKQKEFRWREMVVCVTALSLARCC